MRGASLGPCVTLGFLCADFECLRAVTPRHFQPPDNAVGRPLPLSQVLAQGKGGVAQNGRFRGGVLSCFSSEALNDRARLGVPVRVFFLLPFFFLQLPEQVVGMATGSNITAAEKAAIARAVRNKRRGTAVAGESGGFSLGGGGGEEAKQRVLFVFLC